MEERRMLLVILLTVSGGFADTIGPREGYTNIIRKERESVALSCTFETDSNYIWLYWYRQYPNKEPEYILYKGARSWSSDGDIRDGFQSTTSQSSTQLIIISVTLSDSALYYCALRVVTRGADYSLGPYPLTFGNPIRLTVNPKDVPATPPFLSVLSSINDKGPDICLAAGFFPGEKTMTLKLTDGKDPVSLTTSNAPLLKSTKTYYYAGFNDVNKIQQCGMDEEKADKNPDPDTPLTTPDIPEKLAPQSCETNTGTSASDFIDTGDPKMNSMNLLVTGLRILLAKCVAVNVMMTVKAFIF